MPGACLISLTYVKYMGSPWARRPALPAGSAVHGALVPGCRGER